MSSTKENVQVKKIPFGLTLREIDLISRLRKYNYGVIEVHILNSVIQRVTIKQIQLITDQDGAKAVNENEKESA